MPDVDDAVPTIDRFLRTAAEEDQLMLLGSGEGVWDVLVPSTWKESIAVTLRLGDWSLQGEAFFLRAPEDNRPESFHLLLQRNVRSGPWRFAANAAGDATLHAYLPRAAISEDELDRLLGALVTLSDETYAPYMRLAYQRALEEQVRRGGPGVDQPPPWAR